MLLEVFIHENVRTDEVFDSPGLFWWQWLLISLAILGLLVIIILLLKTKKQTPPKLPSAIGVFDQAVAALPTNQMAQNEFALALSKIIREYLCHSRQSNSIHETNEEINDSLLISLSTSEPTKAELLEFLNDLETLKYGDLAANNSQPESILRNAHLLIHKVEWELTQQSPVPVENQPTQ